MYTDTFSVLSDNRLPHATGHKWHEPRHKVDKSVTINSIALDFAVDISLLAETRCTFQEMTTNLETEAGKVGLRIHANKTKVMQVGEVEVLQPINVGG